MHDVTTQTDARDERVLILARDPGMAALAAEEVRVLGAVGRPVGSVDGLTDEVGDGVALAVVAGALVTDALCERLGRRLAGQPDWSEFPLVIVAEDAGVAGEIWGRIRAHGLPSHVVLVQPPLQPVTLRNAIDAALRTRRRQYELRDELARRAKAERRLKRLVRKFEQRGIAQTQMLALLRDVATAANAAQSTEEALSYALGQVCQHTGWVFGHAFLPARADPEVLVPVEASYQHASERFEAFRRATFGIQLRRGESIAGHVFATGQAEWTRSVEDVVGGNRARLGETLGIAMIAAFPILSGNEVVGVLEFFADEADDPSPEVLDAMANVGTQLGRVIERDRAERTLRESYRLVQRISDTSPMMVRLVDVPTGRFVYVNEQLADFLGYSIRRTFEHGNAAFTRAIHPADRAAVAAAEQRLGGQLIDEPVVWQARLQRGNADWRWVRTWSVVFTRREDGTPGQVLSVSVDVTEPVEAEEKLRRTEQLAAIGTLAAGITHEINNPLASVIMTAQLIRRKKLPPQVHEMLGHVIEDAKRCARIVQSVRKFAQREITDHVPLDLNTVVRSADELCRATTQRRGVGVMLELAEALPQVTANATELEQVVQNLITNAAHASSNGQQVVVRTAAADGTVHIAVQDEGVGMAPEVRRRAFDPFFTTRGQDGGTGLGLSIVHGIVENHRGTIEIDTQPRRGTTVRVSLPAAAMTEDQA
jgi:PAS domain S-box-containing protein